MNGNLFEGMAPEAADEWLTAHCDGGSRGNPGPSGYGAVIEDTKGRVLAELSEFLGIQTNNYAEYAGLLGVLNWAVDHNVRRLRVVSDSELMVKQMQGKYKVASPVLRPLWEEAKKLSRSIEKFEMHHTLRGGNKTADRLANEAMDRGMRKAGGAVSGTGTTAARPYGKLVTPSAQHPGPQPAAKPTRQVLEGYVKGGVIHLLEGELPEGIFVKIVRE